MLAEKYANQAVDSAEIEAQDLTELYYTEKPKIIRTDQIMNISYLGEPGSGKSTAAIADALDTHNKLVEMKLCSQKEPFGLRNIVRDQQEYSMRMRDQNTYNTTLVIDEWSSTEAGGINATAEQSLLIDFSNLCRARGVHIHACSPSRFIDPNTNIIIEMVPGARTGGYTYGKLSYRYYKQGNEHIQLIGHVIIDVRHIIKEWEKVKQIFYKPERTDLEKKQLQWALENDWYTQYVYKKHQKLNLVTQEGVLRPRDMNYAKVRLDVYNRLKNSADLGMMPSLPVISNYVEQTANKLKIPYSMLGKPEEARTIQGALRTRYEIFILKSKQRALSSQNLKGLIAPQLLKERTEELQKLITDHEEMAKEQEMYWRKLVNIHENY